jgi:hypothetical protein
MSREDFILEGSRSGPLEGDDFEEMLEVLIGIAQVEGRDFLAYLLRMALMETRNHNAPRTNLPPLAHPGRAAAGFAARPLG